MVNTKIRLIIFLAAENGEALYCQKKKKKKTKNTRLGANCGSNHELLIVKFRQIEEDKENHQAIQV